MSFPTIADFELRDKIAAAFLTAHRSWKGNAPDGMILSHSADAEALAGIAVTLFHNLGWSPRHEVQEECAKVAEAIILENPLSATDCAFNACAREIASALRSYP